MPRVRLCQVEPPAALEVGPALQDRAAAFAVLVGGDDGEPGRGEHPLALGLGPLGELVGGVALGEGGVDAVAEVHQQLAALPRHDVGRAPPTRSPRRGGRRRRRRSCRRCRRGRGRCRGSPASGGTPATTTPGLEVRRRQHHADGVRPREQPQGGGLGGDAVGGADDGVAGGRVGAQVGERDGRLVGLHRQQHDGVVGPVDLGRRVGGRGVDAVPTVAGVEHQPAGTRIASRCAPRATRVTARPARWRWPPMTPPTAPAP